MRSSPICSDGYSSRTAAGIGKIRLRVSKIFKWFDEDFEPSGGVLAFIRRYAPPETARRLGEGSRVKLAYQDYDWSLNREP